MLDFAMQTCLKLPRHFGPESLAGGSFVSDFQGSDDAKRKVSFEVAVSQTRLALNKCGGTLEGDDFSTK